MEDILTQAQQIAQALKKAPPDASLDPKNLEILRVCVQNRAQLIGPRVGDWVVHPDGKESRITHVYNCGGKWLFQDGGDACGRYHIFRSGTEDYSGSLGYPLPLGQLRDTGNTKSGSVWFFHHGIAGAGRGVEFEIQERVFELD